MNNSHRDSPSTYSTSVHIHGAGFAPLLVAITLHRKFPQLRNKVSVSLGSATGPARAIATFSEMREFNRGLKIAEQSFIKACRASFNLATKYTIADEHYYFSDSDYGFMIERINFHQLYCAHLVSQPSGQQRPGYDEFCLAAALAKAGRFGMAEPNQESPYRSLNYGYQFDELSYAESLADVAKSLGVRIIRDDITSVSVVEGEVHSVQLRAGQALRAGVFIDCSAARDIAAHVHEDSIQSENFPRWARRDTHSPRNALSGSLPSSSALEFDLNQKTITRSFLLRSGSYQSSFQFAPSEPLACSANRLKQSWVGNLLALGEAYASLPGLLIDACYFLQWQLLQLLDIGGLLGAGEGVKTIFNQLSEQSFEQLLDLDNIHLVRLFDRPQLLTANNQARVNLFERSGALFETDNGIISDKHWLALLMAMGFKQQLPDVQTLGLPASKINQQLTMIRAYIQRVSDSSEPHEYWLKRLGV